MEELQVITTLVFVTWVVVIGFAYMVRGPRGAGAVMRWPVVAIIRLMRRMIGGLLISLGNWIRG